MRADRRFLYWGVFLVALGGVMVAVELRLVGTSTVDDALRLWPLAIVALGAAIALRRTRANTTAWVAAALIPGLALGGAIATGPHLNVECAGPAPAFTQHESGSFTGPAGIQVTTGCGTLSVATSAGSGWMFDAGNTSNATASVTSSPTGLSIAAGDRAGALGLGRGRDAWRLTLPTSAIASLTLDVNAGDATVDLAGANVDSLDLSANAGHVLADLTGADVTNLSATMNAGALAIRLPSGQDSTGTVEVNAGVVQLCAPAGVGVRIQQTGALNTASFGGLRLNGGVWQSPDYALAAHHADLAVHVNLGSIEIDPNGGCK